LVTAQQYAALSAHRGRHLRGQHEPAGHTLVAELIQWEQGMAAGVGGRRRPRLRHGPPEAVVRWGMAARVVVER
jgi:hypothetical protein